MASHYLVITGKTISRRVMGEKAYESDWEIRKQHNYTPNLA